MNTLGLVLLTLCLSPTRGLHIVSGGLSVAWTTSTQQDSDFNHMVQSGDGSRLVVAGINKIYSLNTSSFTVLEHVTTGPLNNVNDVTKFMLYNHSSDSVMTCGSVFEFCDIRQIENISASVHLDHPISIDSVAAFIVKFGSNDHFFVACPHVANQNVDLDGHLCVSPGITYYKNAPYLDPTSWKFKPYEVTNIRTEKFVAAFPISKHRLFFSVQKDSDESAGHNKESRIAQLCQNDDEESMIEKTYVDMPVRCGAFSILQAVDRVYHKQINDTVIVGVFTDELGLRSAVCAYTFSSIKSRLADNVKRCYARNLTSYYYFISVNSPCHGVELSGDIYNYGDDFYLCNELLLMVRFNAIGDMALQQEPILVHATSTITAVSVTAVRHTVVAFLGTSNGHIHKAVVYPVRHSPLLGTGIMVDRGHRVLRDMYISTDGHLVFALTKYKVVKVSVEDCGQHMTCGACLESLDPYCGWCLLETRCSTEETCTLSQWIGTSENYTDQQCPQINHIQPNILAADEIHNLTLTLSHNLTAGLFVTCQFNTNLTGIDFNVSSRAVATTNPNEIKCRSPIISAIENRINGYVQVAVNVITNVSVSPVAVGHITIFKCTTFHRCGGCIHPEWKCIWCVFEGRCISDEQQCIQRNVERVSEAIDCPAATGYITSATDSDIQDQHGVLYMSSNKDYDVQVTGTNFLSHPDNVKGRVRYTCSVTLLGTVVFDASQLDTENVICHINEDKYDVLDGSNKTQLAVHLNGIQVDGATKDVVFYECRMLVKPANNCGKCKSFEFYKKYFHCHWCDGRCTYRSNGTPCNITECPNPVINKVFPLSGHINATVLINITGVNLGAKYNDTVEAVTVAGMPCISDELKYIPSDSISCLVRPSHMVKKGPVVVTLPNKEGVTYQDGVFDFRVPNITSIFPSFGPHSGGTNITVHGYHLLTGRKRDILIAGNHCWQFLYNLVEYTTGKGMMMCTTSSYNGTEPETVDVEMRFDGESIQEASVNFTYLTDPNITSIWPRQSFESGGRRLTVKGHNLHSIQKPKIFAIYPGQRKYSYDCSHGDKEGRVLYCPSPALPNDNSEDKRHHNRAKRSISSARLGFEMDAVAEVRNLEENIALISYYPDPTLNNFTEVKSYSQVLIISGERLSYAASKEDVMVTVGCRPCNLTSMDNISIICEPPEKAPNCDDKTAQALFPVQVHIGFIKRSVGEMQYSIVKPPNPEDNTMYIILAVAIVVVVLAAIIGIVLFKQRHMKRLWRKEKKGLEYKMDKMEATFRNQCREEFAALQTAMSDLTSELEGENELFWDYDQYACKTLFTVDPHPLMSPPTVSTEKSAKEMELFKTLLRNQQFLLMFIKTLEKQKSFTINDKSNVATILTVLNNDNMEYITGILKVLLNELIDKNVAANTPKLLLRKSESVSEKLLTHWLSVCLYHYLKEHAGSVLYILYKAIKIQVDRGPVDFITACAKYTLSEDKLYTATDTDNPQVLTLEVHLENGDDQTLNVAVLDCDTITQAKSKILQMLYKNIGHSHRPAVATTALEIEEGGARRILSDEDASSCREGLWKKLNTLQHYNVKDGAKVYLYLNRKQTTSSANLQAVSADSHVFGSLRKSKPVSRTISGANFWHLTKQHTQDDEVKLASDLFLPRLISTKGTLQQYIDDFYKEILRVPTEAPIIIKYLFDFLDTAANRCNITDPDVLHTWKCNSLLLRFWVNIIKNPEFVFDIHKPLIVDSCLSVIAQTLMDSCSTADLRLGPSSPSNKLLFAKDIPRYKTMVRDYFKELKTRPAVSDQELNSFLTQKVSQKYSGKFHQSTALLEMYNYANKYRKEIGCEMDNLEAEHPGSFSPLNLSSSLYTCPWICFKTGTVKTNI